VAKEKPEKLLDDVIDAKVAAIFAERDGDIFDDADQVQEEADAKATKLCQLLREQKMEAPRAGARGRIQIRKQERAKAKDKARAKINK